MKLTYTVTLEIEAEGPDDAVFPKLAQVEDVAVKAMLWNVQTASNGVRLANVKAVEPAGLTADSVTNQ